MERRDRTTFFTLPPELRNYIYELVVVQSDPGPLRIQGSNRRLEQPAVSMACREMRNATLPTFYGENVIRFSDRGITVDAVYRDIVQGRQTSEIVNTLMEAECDDILGSALAWLRKIGPRNVALVKQLHLELSPFNKKFVFRKGPTSVACLMPERVRLQQVLVQYSGTAGIPLPPRMLVEKDEWEIRGEYTRETMVLEFPVTDDSALVHEAQGVAEESEPTRALPEDEAEEAVVFS